MSSQAFEKKYKNTSNSLKIVKFAFIASVILFFILQYVFLFPESLNNPLDISYLLWVGAAVAAAAVLFIKSILFGEKLPTRHLTSSIEIEGLDEGEQKKLEKLNLFSTNSIIYFALCESISSLGFVVPFFTGTAASFIPFGLASIFLLVVTAPNIERYFSESRNSF